MSKDNKKGKDFWGLFVQRDDDEESAPPPTPAPIPGAPAPIPSAATERYLGVSMSSAVVVVDPGILSTIDAALMKSAPRGYKDFIDDLATLAGTLEDKGLLYRTALQFAVKQGHTAQGLVDDCDRCDKLLEIQEQEFKTTEDAQIEAKVGARQRRVTALDADIARLKSDLARAEGEREAEVLAIATDTEKIEGVRRSFRAAIDHKKAQLQEQRTRLAALVERDKK